MTVCGKCPVQDCSLCQKLNITGPVQCRDRFRACVTCGKIYCHIHLVGLRQDMEKVGIMAAPGYCHACIPLIAPGFVCERTSKRNYVTQEKCQGCPIEWACPVCSERPTKVCHTNSLYPTTKCHECGKDFCDSHLLIDMCTEKKYLRHVEERREIQSRCHACFAYYKARPYECDFCEKESPTRLLACSLCHRAYYCNKECQKKGWRESHKQSCNK